MGYGVYGAIDGLRMIAAFGIVMMHIRTNSIYEITGYVYNTIIPSFTNFVFLFMTVSAFGMCCGYYDKILKGGVDFTEFYGKRFKKILPFFGALVLLDIIMSPSVASLYEGFADLTLLFGLLPNACSITVIGVGWFLGIVFVFYLIFPFFCVLIENKRRAWIAFAVSLIYNFVCANYFEVARSVTHKAIPSISQSKPAGALCKTWYAGGLFFVLFSKCSQVHDLINPAFCGNMKVQ